MGRIDPPGPTCEACKRPLVRTDGGSWACVNQACPRHEDITDREND